MIDGHAENHASLEAFLVHYQDVIRRGDRVGLAEVFHPSATVSYPDGDALVSVSGHAFATEVADLVETGVTVDERTRQLVVTVVGSVASLRVDFSLQIGDDRFEGTDFYSVVRLGDGWQITHKLYDMIQIG